jgi:hypothetical protein
MQKTRASLACPLMGDWGGCQLTKKISKCIVCSMGLESVEKRIAL